MANEKAPISSVRNSKRRLRLMIAKEGEILVPYGGRGTSAFFPPDKLFTFLQRRFIPYALHALLRNKPEARTVRFRASHLHELKVLRDHPISGC